MVFLSAIAGPSRLPWRVIPSITPLTARTRRSASTEAAPTPAQDSAVADAAEASVELDDKDSKHARLKEKQFYGSKAGYQAWLKTGAASQFYSANKGQKAQWMDSRMPYPTNPSFKPPPPLSNDLQDSIYRLVKTGKKVGQIAEQFNVSKARIEAIRKLKDLEREYREQKIPLQTAFLAGMEPLLGVEPEPRNRAKDSQSQIQLDRESAARREDAPGTAIEREEEQRLDAGIGAGGAFGNTLQAERAEGIERTVFEFRSEELIMLERELEAKAAAKVDTPAEKDVAKQEAAPDTPDSVVVEAVVEKKSELPSKIVQPGKNKYRFVDISKR